MNQLLIKFSITCGLLLLFCTSAVAQTTVFLVDFQGVANGATSGTNWYTDASNCNLASSDHFEVQNETFLANDIDGEGIWYTTSIDISAYQDVSISVELSESGSMESSDYVKVAYKLDGGVETQFQTNGYLENDFTSATATQQNLNGNVLQVIVRFRNNSGSEDHYLHSVTVSGQATSAVPLDMEATISHVSCLGGNNGAIDLTASGGSGTYTYVWSDGSTSQDLTDQESGVYAVTVSDGTHTVSDSFVIEPGTELLLDLFHKAASPDEMDGNVYTKITEGTAPYTYSWTNGSTYRFAFDVASGAYSVTITDANGCNVIGQELVNEANLHTVFYEDFERNTGGWILTDMLGNSGNSWQVANDTCAYHSYSLSVSSGTACNYQIYQPSKVWAYHAVDAELFEDMQLSFNWRCYAEPGYDYGAVWLSTDGNNWARMDTGGFTDQGWYEALPNWQTQVLPLPDSLNDTRFFIAFEWINDGSIGFDPPFMVDNVHIQGYPMAPQAPVAADPTPEPDTIVACPAYGVCTWLGAESSKWNNRYNWDCDRVPNNTDLVLVQPHKPHNLLLDTVATCLGLEISGTDTSVFSCTNNAFLSVNADLIIIPELKLSAGTIIMDADTIGQAIGVSPGVELNHLTIRNGSDAGVRLNSSQLMVNGKLSLLDGLLYTQGNSLMLRNKHSLADSVLINYTDSSYVIGSVTHTSIASGAVLTYPIGVAGNKPFAARLTIDTSTLTGPITASFIDSMIVMDTSYELTTDTEIFTKLNTQGFWQFEADTSNTDLKYHVELLISNMDSLVDNEFIVVTRLETDSGWTTDKGIVPGNNEFGRMVHDKWARLQQLNKLVQMGIATHPQPEAPAPAYTVAHARYDDLHDIAELELLTNQSFEIGDPQIDELFVERSLDGSNFEQIDARIKLNPDGMIQVQDPKPQRGTVFYRLGRSTTQGSNTYSPMVTITKTYSSRETMVVFPNPNDGLFHIDMTTDDASIQLIINDMAGNIVYNFSGIIDGSHGKQTIDLRGKIQSGHYLVRLMAAGQTQIRKISVAN